VAYTATEAQSHLLHFKKQILKEMGGALLHRLKEEICSSITFNVSSIKEIFSPSSQRISQLFCSSHMKSQLLLSPFQTVGGCLSKKPHDSDTVWKSGGLNMFLMTKGEPWRKSLGTP